MENPAAISSLNDFIFCPASIYFHMIEDDTDRMTYQTEWQLNGTAAHEKSDNGTYSNRADMLQGFAVYCEKYGLQGRIDTFDIKNGILTERKRTIRKIYDGYVFQIYAQYFALTEMGYSVKELRLYSMTDNRSYKIEKPENDEIMSEKFEKTVTAMREFSFDHFRQDNAEKCRHCIYEPLCSFSEIDMGENNDNCAGLQ